jgi:hypothetical protein
MRLLETIARMAASLKKWEESTEEVMMKLAATDDRQGYTCTPRIRRMQRA